MTRARTDAQAPTPAPVRPRARKRAAPVAVAPAAGAATGELFGGFIHEPFTGAWQMNRECSPGTALAFSGVYACVSTIAEDIAKLPVQVKALDADGVARDLPDHWLARLFRRPNPYQTRLQFLQQYVTCKLLAGNVYVTFIRDDRNVPIAMFILDPRTVTPYVSDSGEVFYGLRVSHSNGNLLARVVGENPMIPASEVLHDRMNTAFHPLIGISPLYAAGASAATGMAITKNSQAFFQNMSRASGILSAPGKVSKETAERLAQRWKQNFSQGNIGNVAILGDGVKWEPMSMTAVDAQLIEQLRWSLEDVARVFRVPLFMLGDQSKVTYRNSEAQNRNYYSSTLQSQLEAIELSFDKFFGFTRSVFTEFDLDSLFRTDMDTRFSAYQTGIAAGILSINEARAKENLPPVKGGEEPRVQMQYVPISKATGEPEPEPEPTNPDEEPDEEPENPDDLDEPPDDDEPETRDVRAAVLIRAQVIALEGLSYGLVD